MKTGSLVLLFVLFIHVLGDPIPTPQQLEDTQDVGKNETQTKNNSEERLKRTVHHIIALIMEQPVPPPPMHHMPVRGHQIDAPKGMVQGPKYPAPHIPKQRYPVYAHNNYQVPQMYQDPTQQPPPYNSHYPAYYSPPPEHNVYQQQPDLYSQPVQYSNPPHEQYSHPSHEQYPQPPHEQYPQPPHEQYPQPPHEQYPQPPHEHYSHPEPSPPMPYDHPPSVDNHSPIYDKPTAEEHKQPEYHHTPSLESYNQPQDFPHPPEPQSEYNQVPLLEHHNLESDHAPTPDHQNQYMPQQFPDDNEENEHIAPEADLHSEIPAVFSDTGAGRKPNQLPENLVDLYPKMPGGQEGAQSQYMEPQHQNSYQPPVYEPEPIIQQSPSIPNPPPYTLNNIPNKTPFSSHTETLDKLLPVPAMYTQELSNYQMPQVVNQGVENHEQHPPYIGPDSSNIPYPAMQQQIQEMHHPEVTDPIPTLHSAPSDTLFSHGDTYNHPEMIMQIPEAPNPPTNIAPYKETISSEDDFSADHSLPDIRHPDNHESHPHDQAFQDFKEQMHSANDVLHVQYHDDAEDVFLDFAPKPTDTENNTPVTLLPAHTPDIHSQDTHDFHPEEHLSPPQHYESHLLEELVPVHEPTSQDELQPHDNTRPQSHDEVQMPHEVFHPESHLTEHEMHKEQEQGVQGIHEFHMNNVHHEHEIDLPHIHHEHELHQHEMDLPHIHHEHELHQYETHHAPTTNAHHEHEVHFPQQEPQRLPTLNEYGQHLPHHEMEHVLVSNDHEPDETHAHKKPNTEGKYKLKPLKTLVHVHSPHHPDGLVVQYNDDAEDIFLDFAAQPTDPENNKPPPPDDQQHLHDDLKLDLHMGSANDHPHEPSDYHHQHEISPHHYSGELSHSNEAIHDPQYRPPTENELGMTHQKHPISYMEPEHYPHVNIAEEHHQESSPNLYEPQHIPHVNIDEEHHQESPPHHYEPQHIPHVQHEMTHDIQTPIHSPPPPHYSPSLHQIPIPSNLYEHHQPDVMKKPLPEQYIIEEHRYPQPISMHTTSLHEPPHHQMHSNHASAVPMVILAEPMVDDKPPPNVAISHSHSNVPNDDHKEINHEQYKQVVPNYIHSTHSGYSIHVTHPPPKTYKPNAYLESRPHYSSENIEMPQSYTTNQQHQETYVPQQSGYKVHMQHEIGINEHSKKKPQNYQATPESYKPVPVHGTGYDIHVQHEVQNNNHNLHEGTYKQPTIQGNGYNIHVEHEVKNNYHNLPEGTYKQPTIQGNGYDIHVEHEIKNNHHNLAEDTNKRPSIQGSGYDVHVQHEAQISHQQHDMPSAQHEVKPVHQSGYNVHVQHPHFQAYNQKQPLHQDMTPSLHHLAYDINIKHAAKHETDSKSNAILGSNYDNHATPAIHNAGYHIHMDQDLPQTQELPQMYQSHEENNQHDQHHELYKSAALPNNAVGYDLHIEYAHPIPISLPNLPKNDQTKYTPDIIQQPPQEHKVIPPKKVYHAATRPDKHILEGLKTSSNQQSNKNVKIAYSQPDPRVNIKQAAQDLSKMAANEFLGKPIIQLSQQPNKITSAYEILYQNDQFTEYRGKQSEPTSNVYEGTNIPGTAGVDYPVYAFQPPTTFTCNPKLPGFFADVESRCQVWHYCDLDGREESFLCPNGTLFNQKHLNCDWWYNVECHEAEHYFQQNDQLYNHISVAQDRKDRLSSQPSQLISRKSDTATDTIRSTLAPLKEANKSKAR